MNQDNTTSGAPSSLLSDSATVNAIRRFLADENKPSNLEPIDLLVTVYLMTRKAEDHGIVDSLQTLSRRFNVSTKTVARALKRLASGKVDYVSRHRRRGQSSTLALNHQNIPAEEAVRLRLSEDAGTLAQWYKFELQKRGRKRRFGKHFVSAQKVSAQRILNACGGDLVLAQRVVLHALNHPRHENRSADSLYHLYGKVTQIKATFALDNPGTPISPSPLPPPPADKSAPASAPRPAGIAPDSIPAPVATAEHPFVPILALADRIKRKLSIRSPAVGGKWEQTILNLTNQGASVEEIGRTFDFISEKIAIPPDADSPLLFAQRFDEFREWAKDNKNVEVAA